MNIDFNKNGLFWGMGVGKTLGSINFGLQKGYKKFIVVCPKILINQWKIELAKFDIEYLIFNAEQLIKNDDIIAKFIDKDIFIIVDEVHLLYKNHKSERTKDFIKVISQKIDSNQIVVLSGTPIKKNELDLFAIFLICNRYFYDFRGRKLDKFNKFKEYFFQFDEKITKAGRKFEVYAGFRGKEEELEFYTQFNNFFDTIRVEDTKFFELLPSKKYEIVYIEPNQLFYDWQETIKNGILKDLEKTEVLQHKIQIINKIRQITDGFYYTDYGVMDTNNFKLEKLAQILERIDEKDQVIILAPFIYSIDKIYNDIKEKYSVSKFDEIEDFIAGKKRILIGSQKKLGTGLNLQNANHIIFYANEYDFSSRTQAESRIWRQGQKKNCYFYDLIINRSYDVEVLKIMSQKQDILESFYNFCSNNY